MIRGLTVSEAGVLYGANFQQVAKANGQGGMERSLSPTGYLGATFETVTRHLDDGATLWGLWLFGSQLWSIDSSNIRLMTYYDTLARPVSLSSPLDEAPGIGTIINDTISDVRLDWESLSGATSYQWQFDDDNDFSSIPGGFEGAVTASSVPLPDLSPDTTYYWRVRAVGPVLSPWSDRWSFTTSLGGEIVTLSLMSPLPGARDVPLRPLFQWTAIAGANGYELVASGDVNFANPAVLRIAGYALPGNAWQSDISLNYDTTYYWQVRAVSATSSGAWSAVGVFTTRPPPVAEAEPATASSPPATPPAPAQPVLALSDEAVYVVVFLGAVMILLLATILVMVARRY